MQSERAARHERFMKLTERHIGGAVEAGVCRVQVDEQSQAGEYVTIDDRKLLNFGSCAYLGLNVDQRLKAGATAAIDRYGPVFSSSTAYTSVDLYAQLRQRLEQIFEAHVILPTTTTLGHLSALPVLVGVDDLVLVDVQTHASVHMATQLLRAEGIPVNLLPHNDVAALEAAVATASPLYHRVWYLADGVYSMFGDTAPVREVAAMMARYDNLHVYYDDAHGFGWQGSNGRGFVLDIVPHHPRMVVAVSLAKSFGSGGAALVFPDRDLARRVEVCGGTMTFSGPIHPAELGAAVASADIHLSPEHAERQARLLDQIDVVRSLVEDHDLPVPALDPTPIWFVRVGGFEQALELTQRLVGEGFWVNISAFPAVPLGKGGIRFTNTLYHTDAQIAELVAAIAHHVPLLSAEPDVTVDLRERLAEPSATSEAAAAS
jgi:7-keto-8-aminopelargonate synthetase-like enzyme